MEAATGEREELSADRSRRSIYGVKIVNQFCFVVSFCITIESFRREWDLRS
jgi:hypothetical protein